MAIAFCLASILAFLPSRLSAATLSDPEVDKYNVRVGTQTFSGLYKFTTNTLLVETAQAITNMGSDILKMEIASGYWGKYGIPQNPAITSLKALVSSEPSCRAVFDMPFRRYILWATALSTGLPDWKNGYTSTTDQNNDYREIYDLTRYLLTNYNNSGKSFFLGHWEGDGYLNVTVNGTSWATNPPPQWTAGFVAYLNNRQKAIDDAKAATTVSNVNVYGYAECNRVRDAMNNTTNNNQRMINWVIPYVTNLDYVSYSSYDMQQLSDINKQATMDYIEAHLPTNKAAVITGERVWIGEYGYGGSDNPDVQEPKTRDYIQWLLNYGRKGIPHILFWEIYDNETNSDGTFRYYWLVSPDHTNAPCYYLHQRFANNARLFTARFKENNGRVPNDAEFVGLVSPQLDAPLSAPVPLSFANVRVSLIAANAAMLAADFSQGVYGGERAFVSLFYGRQDGGITPGAWENQSPLGLYTNFNSANFSTIVSNLIGNTNYYFRFRASTSSNETWTAASQLSATVLNPPDYGYRMKLTFSGYNGTEQLANFPVLINLSSSLPGFAYRQFASPVGGDLRFTDANGFLILPHEIDEWNTNGTSRVWARVQQLTSTNDFIWAYWGNPVNTNAPASSTNGAVWSSDHFLVWHLKENGFPYKDSAAQFPAVSGVAPVSTPGVIGLGEGLNGSSQFAASQQIALGNQFTISALVKIDATATNIQTILANKPSSYNSAGFGLFVNSYNTADKKLCLETGDGVNGQSATSATGAVSYGVWHHIAAAVDRSQGSARLYVDGQDVTASSVITSTLNSTAPLNLGRLTNNTYYFKGVLDEVRVESGLRSSNWISAASSTALANTTLATYSTATQQLPALSLIASPDALTFTWPAGGTGFSLSSATDLTPPVTWVPATNLPLLTNSHWQVALPNPGQGPDRFYRLQSP